MGKRIKYPGITQNLFIETMSLIEKQFRHDSECNKAFKVIMHDDYVSCYDNDSIFKAAINILEHLMNDEDKWIDYFIYELDFGAKYREGSVRRKDGSFIDLSNSLGLWIFLNE